MVRGSVAYRVLHYAPCPVLVGHEVADRRVHIKGENGEEGFAGGAAVVASDETAEAVTVDVGL